MSSQHIEDMCTILRTVPKKVIRILSSDPHFDYIYNYIHCQSLSLFIMNCVILFHVYCHVIRYSSEFFEIIHSHFPALIYILSHYHIKVSDLLDLGGN